MAYAGSRRTGNYRPGAQRIHQFSDSLARGHAAERTLDRALSMRYQLSEANAADQKRGIDRYGRDYLTGEVVTLEYKTDWRSGATGNVFVELICSTGQLGWARSCQADWLILYLPHTRMAYAIKTPELRQRLQSWEALCQSRTVTTNGKYRKYSVDGLLVPVRELEKLAWEKFDVNG